MTAAEEAAGSLLPEGSSVAPAPAPAAAASADRPLAAGGDDPHDPRSRYGAWSLVPRRPEEVATALRFDFDDTAPAACGANGHRFDEAAKVTLARTLSP